MFIRKLADVDAFVAVDLGDVPGHGVVRCAPKVLQGGAKDLARTTTYALAVLGRRETGISAGINAAPDDRDAAVAAFAAEVAGWDAGYRLVAAKGVEPDTLGSVEAASGGTSSNAALLATGAVAAARAACPDATTALVDDPAGTALVDELAAHGIQVVAADDPLTAEADLLFLGAKVGMLDHAAAARLRVRAVVPTGPLPVTTKAVAHCRRHGVLALPDFVTTVGPLVGDAETVRSLVAEAIGAVVGHEDGPTLGACERAESFLVGWQDDLPFGRPMAA